MGILVIGLVLVVASFLQCSVLHGAVRQKWETYQSPDGTFSVQHPANLSPKTKQDKGAFAVSFQAGGSAAATTGGLLGLQYTSTGQTFAVIEGDAQGGDAQQWATLLKSHGGIPAYRELLYEATTLNGQPAYRWRYQSSEKTSGGDSVVAVTDAVFIVSGTHLFFLVAEAPKADFDQATADRFVHSLQIK